MTPSTDSTTPGCDETYFDVKLRLPITLRFLAEDAESASAQWLDCKLHIVGPQQSFSIGFPVPFFVTKVEEENHANP